jgi:phosphoribosylformylglycinamidine cyclo-ligase
MNYKDAGVDIEAGNAFVEKIKKIVPTIGGFNGMMRIPKGYANPVLISGTDGVGTKINIAKIARDYTTIGEDLVAMCVNDVICSGAKPLYFLDYISTGKIDQDILGQVMQGILKGCEIADMQLLGGETAEHPKVGGKGSSADMDLAGFCTGVVEENQIVDGRNIYPGDAIIGIESSGLHSNGFSLINDMIWRQKIYFGDMPELLTPTHIYAPVIKELLKKVPLLGMAHITGGGIPENLPRCLPPGLTVDVDYWSWERPEIFNKIEQAGDIEEKEMRNVFNLGIGFCIVVPSERVGGKISSTIDIINRQGLKAWVIGQTVVK